MANQEAVWGNNATSANDHFEWGPTTLIGVYKLLRVQIDISFGFPGTNLSPSAILLAETVWGVQYGVSGYTPLVLPGDMSNFQYLITDLAVGDSTGVGAWTPPTNDVGVISFATLSRKWYGQRVIENDVDLWVNYNPIVTGAGFVAASWRMLIDWI
jgi:hypothetical protein